MTLLIYDEFEDKKTNVSENSERDYKLSFLTAEVEEALRSVTSW